jgi:hypothetical protein
MIRLELRPQPSRIWTWATPPLAVALTMLADAATRTPEAAAAIADDFLTHWQSRLSPAGDLEDEQRLFFFYREAIPAAPLTRGRQRRNLERLQTVMSTIAATGVDPRTLPSIASAFKACHGRSEVFDREEIVRVFGPVEAMPATTAVSLAGTMAANLNGDWRNRAAQQETGTKRSDNEIAALVDKGYGVAMELAEAASAREPNSWRVAALRAGLAFDRMQFRNAQKKADAASLNDARKAAFEAFEAAAGVYAAALARGEEREDARVFTVWFGAALGTPQLNFVNVEELPTEGSIGDDQIERIRKAINAMEPDATFRHLSDFASDVSEAVMRSDPEVKPRLVKHALRIIGDHPAGASLRAMARLTPLAGREASRTCSGRSSRPMVGLLAMTAARSMMFWSSRTLPGYEYARSASAASGEKPTSCLPSSLAKRSRNRAARRAMSARRSRSGGSSIFTTVSWMKRPLHFHGLKVSC